MHQQTYAKRLGDATQRIGVFVACFVQALQAHAGALDRGGHVEPFVVQTGTYRRGVAPPALLHIVVFFARVWVVSGKKQKA
jgi:hypothetical protein